MDLWAVVPVKERDRAKERLGPLLVPKLRQALALAMLEDVLAAVAAVADLAGILVVTIDPAAGRMARHYGARLVEDGARDGHTGAVAAAARLLMVDGAPACWSCPATSRSSPPANQPARRAHRAVPSITSFRRMTRAARTRSCCRRPMRCHCALASTAFSRICAPPRRWASARPRCAGRGSRRHPQSEISPPLAASLRDPYARVPRRDSYAAAGGAPRTFRE